MDLLSVAQGDKGSHLKLKNKGQMVAPLLEVLLGTFLND